MRKILFLINPKSGKKKNIRYLKSISKLNKTHIDHKIIYWEKVEQDIVATCIDELRNGYDIFAVIGGDGTVNRMIPVAIESQTPMLILPAGSGNGLARHLKISMKIPKALALIYNGKVKSIDAGKIDDKYFAVTSGLGFDAHIGHLFSYTKTRGWFNYFKIIIGEFRKYKSQDYIINIDGKIRNINAFLVTIANANQWGNNFYIAPQADVSDGLLDVCILKPFSFFNAFGIALKLMQKKAHRSRHIEIHKGKEVYIERLKEGFVHYDGEPDTMGRSLQISVIPNAVQIIYP